MTAKEIPLDVVLASRSPRRRELLLRLFKEFRVVPSGLDEMTIREADPVRFARAAAEAKARDVGAAHPEALVIAADTVVCLGDEIFGKPDGRAGAAAMLARLSGQRHRVITGIALYRAADDKLVAGHETTSVTFRVLAPEDIESYLDKDEYADKAGSYAVQDVGDAFVEALDGDYDNVVGFPVRRVKRLLKEFRAPEHEFEIEDIAFPKSWPFGTAEGARILVPGSVPGDRALVRITGRKPKSGKVIRLLTPSPRRTDPPCPHFGTCGGCAFQNLDYGSQLELKERYLRRLLAAEGPPRSADVLEPILPSPSPFGYRNKMEFAFAGDGGALRLGLRERSLPGGKSRKRTVGLGDCLIFGPAAGRIFPRALDYANADGRPAFDPLAKRGTFRNLVLREAKATGEIMALLVTRGGELPGAEDWARRLAAECPEVRSVWHVQNDREADVIDFERSALLAGSPWIEETLLGLRFRIHPPSFFQPNPDAASLFYTAIADDARAAEARRVLGLFCGAGAIELNLARTAGTVVGIEADPANILNARENAGLNGIGNVLFVEGRVEKVLVSERLGDFDLLVLDPPREGLHPDALSAASALRVPRIAYMSCNPATFARDTLTLAAGGYRPERILAADFFPHTPHIEVLGFFSR